MSYSVSAKGTDKAGLKASIAAELAKVAVQYPIHVLDIEAAKLTAAAFIDLFPQKDSREMGATVAGSVAWTSNYAGVISVRHINVSVNVGYPMT